MGSKREAASSRAGAGVATGAEDSQGRAGFPFRKGGAAANACHPGVWASTGKGGDRATSRPAGNRRIAAQGPKETAGSEGPTPWTASSSPDVDQKAQFDIIGP